MGTSYYGVFENGLCIEKKTIEEINDTTDVLYILRCIADENARNSPTTFTLITSDGKKNKLRIGNFELVDISEESGTRREITIKDIRLGNIFQVPTHIGGVNFFHEELLPFMNKLDEVGSWEMYQKLEELNDVKRKLEQVKKELAVCQTK